MFLFKVYLIIGIMFVMLFISVLTQIPELNLARLFSLEIDSPSDPERQLLAESTNNSTSYTRQIDDEDHQHQHSGYNNADQQQPIPKYQTNTIHPRNAIINVGSQKKIFQTELIVTNSIFIIFRIILYYFHSCFLVLCVFMVKVQYIKNIYILYYLFKCNQCVLLMCVIVLMCFFLNFCLCRECFIPKKIQKKNIINVCRLRDFISILLIFFFILFV